MKSLPCSIARLLAPSLVAFALFVWGGPALAADYTITDLGNLGGNSYATGINASGQVVGYSYTASGPYHAFLYSNGTMRDLGTLGGGYSSADGINASGQVVGGSHITGGVVWNAFLYSNGTMQDLGTLGGSESGANAINASGQVAGWSDIAGGGRHAFLYSNGTMHDLGALGGGYGYYGYATGINASGEVVGYSYTASDNPCHAFLYSNESVWGQVFHCSILCRSLLTGQQPRPCNHYQL